MATVRKIKKILIANRGEIAFRISKTLQRMKIKTVGVCIPAEQDHSFLTLCNEKHVFSKNDLSAYLNIDEIVSIAKRHKVDAIHPGYGFLSENPEFASACDQNDILFIGPEPISIELMGNKHKAKEFAKACGIPVLETVVETKEFDSAFEKNIQQLKLPVILKPLNGGGGKGMTILRNWNDLSKNLEEGRSIAKKAFNDARLMAEPLIEKAFHLEVQIIGDKDGNVRHLFERDCTIQRRHQKIIEETPSPLIDIDLLEKMTNSAVELAKKSSYESLGTVEFIVDPRKGYFFMEMNTRLQVEHPITEITLGLDLVEKQIRIAEGESLLKLLPKKIKRKGHAIEARVYTENPEQNFIPSTGTIEYLSLPKETKTLRIDRGIETGMHIHHSFDPLILKLTVHGKNREQAIHNLHEALKQTVIAGVHTNINYLQWILKHPDFIHSNHYTTWTSQSLDAFTKHKPMENLVEPILQSFNIEKMKKESDWPHDPWLILNLLDGQYSIAWRKNKFRVSNAEYENTIEGVAIETLHDHWVSIHGFMHVIPKIEKTYGDEEEVASNLVRSPMTGTVVRVLVKEGDNVEKNDTLIEMEAMKMQYKISATQNGSVTKIHCQSQDIVEHGSVLVELATL